MDIFAAGILLWEMLAGRRLFKGETDLETFKQVQASLIPDMRQIRSDVTNDVAYVLGKALARDRDQRYPQAGDFAKDLSIVLTRLGKPVTFQDLAKLVTATAGERARHKRREQKDAHETLGDLILDAIHDFSAGSTQDAHPPHDTPNLDARATNADFVNPSEWGLDALFDEAPAPPPRPATAGPRPHAAPTPPGVGPALPSRPPLPAAQRARPPAPAAPTEGGPFWRRWFGG